MRKTFFDLVENYMESDENIYFLTGDLGFKYVDNIKEKYSERYFNVQAAEQLLVGAGVGLALSEKIPICYSITPFIISRPHEWLRNYLDHDKIPVKLVGAGRDKDYIDNGFTHWAEDMHGIMSSFKNIKIYEPHTKHELISCFEDYIYNDKASFLSLGR